MMAGTGHANHPALLELVRAASGLEFPHGRRHQLEVVVERWLERLGIPDAGALHRWLAFDARGRTKLDDFIAELTVGETHFFRNRAQFEALERVILPELIARRAASRRLRIWSAGCASGEEVYSVAILIRRLIPNLDDWSVSILGTDINRQALDKARGGAYGPWSFRQVPADIKRDYFTARGRTLEVDERVRAMVAFDYLNLVDDSYPSPVTGTSGVDLILCRNVLIYFGEPTIRAVVGRLERALAPDGWLLVGHAEPSQATFERFARRSFPGTVVYQKGGPSSGTSPEGAPEPARPAPRNGSARARLDGAEGRSCVLPPTEPGEASDSRAAYLAARFHADRHELDAAERWVDLALSRDPLHAPSHYIHGLILQERGRPDAALGAFRRCVYADPGFALGHLALASVFETLEQPARALRSLDNLIASLESEDPGAVVPDSDGLTVGRLRGLGAARKTLLDGAELEPST